MSNPQIEIPNLCEKHQSLLVYQAGYKPNDSWRALIIISQIAIFQGVTADPKMQKKIGLDITNIKTLGCLACQKPDIFGEVVEAAKTHDFGNIKKLGEKYIKKGSLSNKG